MSDRVAVMLGGKVLQFGTPREVYERPATIDVAGFIGSPRINILPAEADARGALSFAGRRTGVAVPGITGEVRIGIRPEHVGLQADGMACDIRHVEFLGAEVLVYLREPQTGTELIARLSPEAWAAQDRGRTAGLALPAARLLAFGADGGRLALSAEHQAVQALV